MIRTVLLVALFALSVPRPSGAQTLTPRAAQGIPIASPYLTESRTMELLDYLSVRAMLPAGYLSVSDSGGGALPGALDTRKFVSASAGKVDHYISVDVIRHPEGRYEYYVRGQQQGSTVPNPDVPRLHALISGLVGSVAEEKDANLADRISYRVFPLSYIQADRALALLKTMGYSTTEFTGKPGESDFEQIFSPQTSGGDGLPAIVKFLDAPKTSIIDPAPQRTSSAGQGGGRNSGGLVGGVPDIGGSYLHHATSGEALQRLLILYDPEDPQALEDLMNLLRSHVDLPARQILIEAMVIEVNTDRLFDLGVQSRFGRNEANDEDDPDVEVESINQISASFERDRKTGGILPFTFAFDNLRGASVFEAAERFFGFSLEALISENDAEILSRPSVLALDGRQARIQVGQQVPVTRSTATASGIISSVDYFPVGIVLNLRPRVNVEGDEITMQVEAIVSSISSSPGIGGGGGADVFFAPFVDNRQVQTFVRVANDTPFIVGGLISRENREVRRGIPVLSQIPLLGRLFRSTSTDHVKREVIVVLAPHVVPLEEKNFSYVIPKDGDLFDSFDYTLFRNAYRIRDDDLFDLRFVDESPVYRDLLLKARAFRESRVEDEVPEAIHSILSGYIPGEEIFVRRMIWEIINDLGFHESLDPDRILVFEPDAEAGTGSSSVGLDELLAEFDAAPENTLSLSYHAVHTGTPDRPFSLPTATVAMTNTDRSQFYQLVDEINRFDPESGQQKYAIPITKYVPRGVRSASALQVLQGALVLKRVLELNGSMPLTLDEFKVGREIILPTEADLRQRFHIIDREIAQYVYETYYYYPVFERSFNTQLQTLVELIERDAR